MKLFRVVAIASAIIVGLTLVAVAGANLTSVNDPADDQASGGKQNDLINGTAGHAGRKLVHTASFDVNKSNDPPELLIRSRGKRYVVREFQDAAQVIRVRTGKVTGFARLVLADDNTWRFDFRRRAIGRPKLGYGWALLVPGQGDQPDPDRLPDTGLIRHNLG